MVWHGSIQRGAGGERGTRPQAHIPVAPAHPLARGNSCRAATHPLDCIRLRASPGQVDVEARPGVAKQMRMCVDEAREHGAAAQIERLGEWTCEATHLRGAPDGENPARDAIDRDRGGAWARGIHRVKRSIQQQQERATDRIHSRTFLLPGIAPGLEDCARPAAPGPCRRTLAASGGACCSRPLFYAPRHHAGKSGGWHRGGTPGALRMHPHCHAVCRARPAVWICEE